MRGLPGYVLLVLLLSLTLSAPAASDDYGRGWCDGQAQMRRHRIEARAQWRKQLELPSLSLYEATVDIRQWPPAYCRQGFWGTKANEILCTFAASVDLNLMPSALGPDEVIYVQLADATWLVCPSGERYADFETARQHQEKQP